MNRRFLSLLLLLIAGLALWLTSRWWLPWLLAQLPRIQANSDLIQAIEALVNIAWLLFSAAIGYLLWLSRPGAKPQADRDLQDAILTQVSVARLLEELGQGANLNWIDRGAVRPADLRLHGRVVITGRSGLGKTREAIELIRRAVDDDLVLPDRIFRPGPALRFVNPEAFVATLARSFDPHLPVLLIVDDLPYHFTGDNLAHLTRLIDALAQSKVLYVVATARSDQLMTEHDDWLEQQRFHPNTLRDLTANDIARLVDSGGVLFSLQVPDDARDAFAKHGDGTPQHPVIALRLLRQQGRERISVADARGALSDSAVQAWAETRRYITDPQRAPAAAYILDALAHFHIARLTAYRSLVIPYGAFLAHTARAPRGEGRRRTLEQALTLLGKYDIRTDNRLIRYRDEIAAPAPSTDLILGQLATFLTCHRRILHRSWFRFLSTAADEHSVAVSDLAERFQERQESNQALEMYKLAKSISPHAMYYYVRGGGRRIRGDLSIALDDLQRATVLAPRNARLQNRLGNIYADLGRYEEAIVAYQQAITLKSAYAYPHNGLGNVYSELGRYDEAIAAYRQAISIDPTYAQPYHGLGNVYSELGRYEEAVAAYNQAIIADRNNAYYYYDLGNTYLDLQLYEQAVATYRHAISLNAKLPYPYSNLGVVYTHLGRHEEAIAAYLQAIGLDPRDAFSHYGLGHAYSDLGKYEDAIATYQRAIALDPKDASSRKGLGNAYRALDRYEEAIAAYQQAITIDPMDAFSHYCLGQLSSELDHHEEAVAAYQQAVTLDDKLAYPHVALARIFRRLGNNEEYRKHVVISQALIAEVDDEYLGACIASVCGDVDEALALLEAAIAKEPGNRISAQREPDFDFIRDDPRFQALVGEQE